MRMDSAAFLTREQYDWIERYKPLHYFWFFLIKLPVFHFKMTHCNFLTFMTTGQFCRPFHYLRQPSVPVLLVIDSFFKARNLGNSFACHVAHGCCRRPTHIQNLHRYNHSKNISYGSVSVFYVSRLHTNCASLSKFSFHKVNYLCIYKEKNYSLFEP